MKLAPPGISMCHRHLESSEPDSAATGGRARSDGGDAKNKKAPFGVLRRHPEFRGATGTSNLPNQILPPQASEPGPIG